MRRGGTSGASCRPSNYFMSRSHRSVYHFLGNGTFSLIGGKKGVWWRPLFLGEEGSTSGSSLSTPHDELNTAAKTENNHVSYLAHPPQNQAVPSPPQWRHCAKTKKGCSNSDSRWIPLTAELFSFVGYSVGRMAIENIDQSEITTRTTLMAEATSPPVERTNSPETATEIPTLSSSYPTIREAPSTTGEMV